MTSRNARDHALIAFDRDWSLSPAYDLTPAVPLSDQHRDLAMECGDNGRLAGAANLLSQCRRFLLEPGDGERIITGMESRVRAEWYPTARAQGVTENDCARISRAFAYPGFRAR